MLTLFVVRRSLFIYLSGNCQKNLLLYTTLPDVLRLVCIGCYSQNSAQLTQRVLDNCRQAPMTLLLLGLNVRLKDLIQTNV